MFVILSEKDREIKISLKTHIHCDYVLLSSTLNLETKLRTLS